MESFSNILFSSVVGGPSFVHSPHVPNTTKINSSFYYLSILDPNMELPELSTKDIDELLSDSSFNKGNKDSESIIHESIENNFNKGIPDIKRDSLIISSKNSLNLKEGKNSIISMPKFALKKSPITSADSTGVSSKSPYEGILFKCVERTCNQNFPSKSEQMNHFFLEHKDKAIICGSCKAVFKSKYSLNNHCLSNPHCKLKNTYRCSMVSCDKYFFNLHNLELHLSSHHNIPSISCLSHSCDKKFFDCQSRDMHVKISHRELTFKCHHCDEVFLDRGSLEKHDIKLHRDISSRHSNGLPVYICQTDGCEKGFTSLANIRTHTQLCHNNNEQHISDNLLLINSQSLSDIQNPEVSSVLENIEVKLVYACPLPECSEALNDKDAFQSHFLKHFTGELPGDINSLLPPDPPVPGLELHSKTFEANVDYIFQREETNLVQALDLVPDKLLQSLEWLDDDSNVSSPNSCLTSALILPSTYTNSNRNLSVRNGRRRNNPYQDQNSNNNTNGAHCSKTKNSDTSHMDDNNNGPKSKYKCIEQSNLSLTNVLFSPTGSCARTCPKINSTMVNLIKRRRVFLKERVGMMQSCDSVLYQPAARQPALKQVVHQIFNSQQLPNKYEKIVNVDSSEM